MQATKFKVLMHLGQFVDIKRLSQGIYLTSIPTLYSKDATFEGMENKIKSIRHTPEEFNEYFEKYFENLRQCTLVDVDIIFMEQ